MDREGLISDGQSTNDKIERDVKNFLSAVQEISNVVWQAGENGESPQIDEQALQSARDVAEQVANANGFYINKNRDVVFGKRYYDANTGKWPIAWGEQPYNTLKVDIRKTNAVQSAPDAQLKLAFGWAVGKPSVSLTTSAAAFVEARDMVMVMDFSGSMNDDSTFGSSLGTSTTADLLDDMWDAMVAANPKWPGTSSSKFPSSGFGKIDSYEGTYVSSSNRDTIYSSLELVYTAETYNYNVGNSALNSTTAMGYGIRDARYLLKGNPSDDEDLGHARPGARAQMLVMTDGLANVKPDNWSMPSNFEWSDWTQGYEGEGTSYSTSDSKKQYAFWQAIEHELRQHERGYQTQHWTMRVNWPVGEISLESPGFRQQLTGPCYRNRCTTFGTHATDLRILGYLARI